MRKSLKLVVVSALACLVTLAAMPGMAHAASRDCSVNGTWWLPGTCYTDSLPSNSPGRWVDVHVSAYSGCELDYVVRDIANNVVVASGRTNERDFTIFGLYSYYRAEISRVGSTCGGSVIIENELP
ncbi:hypothetical protein OG792_22220 [Micromonospora sp. NBC_01699]|uniref:hypothetical protein n=1 Tax=Micromonospora sp. NBC_01699 TaxID=2975984 RepID=UPI002E2B49A1|nr:hypothetical protein [Micromonospora sp. NBC_01699]